MFTSIRSMIRPDGTTLAVGAVTHTTTRQRVTKGEHVEITDRENRVLNVAEIIDLEYDPIKEQNVVSLRMIA